jgi:uncharacterized protein (DUF1778 family)
MMVVPAPKQERLEARVSHELKALLQRAADLEGRSLTDFLVSSGVKAAQETIHRNEQLRLTARDSAAFVEGLLNPVAPNEMLLAAAQHYREFTAE